MGSGGAGSPAAGKKKELKDNFLWSNKMEPHAARKRDLLKKYGKEINELMGHDPNTKWICLFVVVCHTVAGIYISQLDWIPFLVLTYVVGGSFTHNLFLAIHEVTHYVAFKNKAANDALAMFCNIPLGIPYAMFFKHYHYEHHRYQGWDGIDLDIPSATEAWLLSSFPGKLFFLVFQGLFYALRPTLTKPLPITPIRALNYAVVLTTDYIFYTMFGPNILLYMVLSLLFGTGINPFAGHFLSEHFLMVTQEPEAQETHSYYGWLNIFSWNVGYHNEHHDFPNIAGSRLHKLKAIAPEFYDNLHITNSWFGAQMQFLFDSRVTLWCRMLRERDAFRRTGPLIPTTPDAQGGKVCYSH